MKYIFILFFITSTLLSCSDKVERPSHILDKEKMAATLFDMELLEAVIKQKVIDRKYPKKNVPVYIRQVMDKNEISYEQFEESYTWWENNPAEMKKLYDEVHARLEIKKEELPDVEKKEAKKGNTTEKK